MKIINSLGCEVEETFLQRMKRLNTPKIIASTNTSTTWLSITNTGPGDIMLLSPTWSEEPIYVEPKKHQPAFGSDRPYLKRSKGRG